MSLLQMTGWGWFRLPGEAKAMADADQAIHRAATEAADRDPGDSSVAPDVDAGSDSMGDLLSALQASVDAARKGLRKAESRQSLTRAEGSFKRDPDMIGGLTLHAVSQVCGVSDRQLRYWARTGLVAPSIRSATPDHEAQRLYSFRDVVAVKIVKRLLDAGVSLSNIRVAVGHIQARDLRDLAGVTLFSDGETVYEATSPDEVVDLLQRGKGAFGIAISGAVRELSSAITNFPMEEESRGESDEHRSHDWLLRAVG